MALQLYTAVYGRALLSSVRAGCLRRAATSLPWAAGPSLLQCRFPIARRAIHGCRTTPNISGVNAAQTDEPISPVLSAASREGPSCGAVAPPPWRPFGGRLMVGFGVGPAATASHGACTPSFSSQRHFSTRNISGRLFYRRRPKMVPRYKPKNRRSCWLEGSPQKKGVCVTIRVVTPRKPNSGLRKVARVRLSTGRTVTCHVPGEGHNLHTHSVVLVRGGRCQDVSGCHYKVIRGKYDLLPVKNRVSSRSKYGVRLSDAIVEKRRVRLNRLHVTTELDREVFNRLLIHDWVYPDGTRRAEPVGPGEPVPVDIFTFNSRLRSIVHSSSKG